MNTENRLVVAKGEEMGCREYTAYLLSNSFKLNDSVEPAVIKRKGKLSNRNIHSVLFNQQRAIMEEK